MTTLNIRIDEDLKKEAQATFASLGMDMSTAVKMFFQQTVSDQAFPFTPARKSISKAQQKELVARWDKEYEEALLSAKKYRTAKELLDDIK